MCRIMRIMTAAALLVLTLGACSEEDTQSFAHSPPPTLPHGGGDLTFSLATGTPTAPQAIFALRGEYVTACTVEVCNIGTDDLGLRYMTLSHSSTSGSDPGETFNGVRVGHHPTMTVLDTASFRYDGSAHFRTDWAIPSGDCDEIDFVSRVRRNAPDGDHAFALDYVGWESLTNAERYGDTPNITGPVLIVHDVMP